MRDYGVLHRLDEIIAMKPGKIFLLVGTNDLGEGRKEVADIAADYEKNRQALYYAITEYHCICAKYTPY